MLEPKFKRTERTKKPEIYWQNPTEPLKVLLETTNKGKFFVFKMSRHTLESHFWPKDLEDTKARELIEERLDDLGWV